MKHIMTRKYNLYTKCFSIILTLIVAVTCLPIDANAVAIDNKVDFSTEISASEISAMETAMEARGIGGNVEVEVLYDSDDNPSLLLGTSDSGYQIIARGTLRCIEGGESNPYLNYSSNKKYYGGILNYYVDAGNDFYDITRNTIVSSPSKSDYLDEAVSGSVQAGDTVNSSIQTEAAFSASASATASITFTKIIPNAETRIQRRAFGYNNDNTCSAVACTIVLNYLDYDDNRIVPSNYQLEALTSNSGSNVATDSPRAHAFHRFLVEDCGMGAVSYANGIAYAIDDYRESSTTISNSEIDCEWTLNIYTNFGIDELLADRPTMLTSTIAGDYSWHTMPVYGYRRYSDNSLEWLVHPGWYSRLVYEDGVYRMPEIWVAASTATYLYRFTYDGM